MELGWILYIGCSAGPISAPVDSNNLFEKLSDVTEINFNGWFVTEQVTNMSRMFVGARALQTIYVRTDPEKIKVEESNSFPTGATVIVGKPPVNRSAVLEATTAPTLIDGRKIKQNDEVDYEITVKYHATATAVSQSNRNSTGRIYLWWLGF